MIDPPNIVHTAAQPAAVIRFTIPRAEIRNVMGPAMRELAETAAAQGVGPGGPLFSHHFRMDPGIFDFVVGVPVTAAFSPVGRIESGQLPAAAVVQTIYHGPYEGLAAAWQEFDNWIAANGYKIAGDLWERYVAGPESGPDQSQWRTELSRPLRA